MEVNNLNKAAVVAEQEGRQIQRVTPQGVGGSGGSFAEALTRAQLLSFSKHAEARLSSRDINLTGEQIGRVEGGVAKARAQGVKDGLVLVDDYALVVNMRSGVVVTAVNKAADNRGLFTNIDGAVIV